MLDCFSACASMQMITSWHIWRLYISLWKCWIVSLETFVSWIWCSTFIRLVISVFASRDIGGKTEERDQDRGSLGGLYTDHDTSAI